MKKIFSKVFLLYSAVLAVFITVSGILTLKDINSALFQLAFAPVTLYFLWAVVKEIINLFKKDKKKSTDYSVSVTGKKTEVILGILAFALLLGLGIKNIFFNTNTVSEQNKPANVGSSPEGTAKSDGLVFDKNATSSAQKIVINISDGSSFVNLREEPTTTSKVVSTAKNGDKFDYLETVNGWYKIKLADSSIAYITINYANIEK
jgi:Bacterial SH3 domain